VSSVDAQAWQPPGHWRIPVSIRPMSSIAQPCSSLFVETLQHPTIINHYPPTSSFPPRRHSFSHLRTDITAVSVLAISCIASSPTQSFQHVPALFHLKRPTVPRFRRDLLERPQPYVYDTSIFSVTTIQTELILTSRHLIHKGEDSSTSVLVATDIRKALERRISR
jgi:hypothetical protein